MTIAEKKCLGKGIPFQRTRRITGYLVGSLDRFGDAKRAEERERVKHGSNEQTKETHHEPGNI